MEWHDKGYILATRKHGESALIVSALTQTRGRQTGLVRGGAGRRKRGGLQVGNLVTLDWRGRLPEHLGSLTTEVLETPAAALMNCPDGLAALSAACAVTEALLPEGEDHPAIFHGLAALFGVLDDADVGSAYVKWEMGVLGELGFGLDLAACAATGETENLTYVSPKTGRAGPAGVPAGRRGRGNPGRGGRRPEADRLFPGKPRPGRAGRTPGRPRPPCGTLSGEKITDLSPSAH